MTDQPKHVFLVDGSGFIFRAFHGLPPMVSPNGTPVNAVFGFTKMLMKLLADTDADHIAVIFDRARKTFRSDIYPQYKAQRPPPPDELIPQFELVREATRALNVPAVDMEGFEADDLIATYAKQAAADGAIVTIVSSDKDLMQLVDDQITMLDAMKNKVIGADEVFEKFGVGPELVIDVQALAGDSSDNVPGVQGIGIKTAALLIQEYGDLDSVLARAGEVKQPKRRQSLIEQADMARISRQLVTLKIDVPIDVPLSSFAVRQPDPATLVRFLHEQGFKSLVTTMEGRFGMAPGSGSAAPGEPAKQCEYELVQSVDALQVWIDAANREGQVAVDTETTSLNAMQAKLVGISLAVTPDKACYIPLAHQSAQPLSMLDMLDGKDAVSRSDQIKQIELSTALALLKPLLEDPAVLKIGQNIKYDMHIFENVGISLYPVDDTMLLSYCLEGGLHGHGMDELARSFLNRETIKFKDVAGTGASKITFDQVPLDKALDYAAEDAEVTLLLHQVFKPRLALEHMVSVYECLERPLISVMRKMESEGIRVDATELKRLSDDFAARLADLEVEIHKLAGRPFNIGSPKQLGEILFDEMAIPGGKKGKTGAYATGADILEGLADQGHDLPARVLDWRQLAKLKSTYTDALINQINPQTGRIHTSYSQAVASTGRLASTDPNLQNIPIRSEEGRKIRKAFIAAPGTTLLSADYSQIELRLLAHVAGIDVLKEAFHAGHDIHAITAAQVFNVPIEGMDPMVRRNAKAINFGIIYGISAFGLARQLGISNSEAKHYIDAYFERYPGILAYMERTKEEARTYGYVKTPFGRKCHVRGINEKNPNHRGMAERAAINAPIQGGAADIIKRAMLLMPKALDKAGLAAKMLLQVHDELIFEVPDAEIDATVACVKASMESAAVLDVPLVVDTGLGANWDDAH
ncbi:MAG: DNA polymerase I [Rhodospirillales bacterium]|nr:DNA polymerase I [Rhodospirillales bacterium]